MITRTLVVLHRWLGVGLCGFFLLWFLSGIGMMYTTFPEVTAGDRLQRARALERASIRLSPQDAYAALGIAQPPSRVRLSTFDGRPAYRFETDGVESVVYADTGEEPGPVSRAMMDRAASAWTGQPASTATIARLDRVDQWTVSEAYRSLEPLWKYAWPDGQQVYVSEASGEVVQYTTAAARLRAYLGPIPHWLYFTPLRARATWWTRVVTWASALGALAAALGLAVGARVFSPSRRYRPEGWASRLPYRGLKRWHAAIGLCAGVGALTWSVSGLPSMEPFPLGVEDPRAPAAVAGADIARAVIRLPPLAAFAEKGPRRALDELAGLPVQELEFRGLAGQAFYLATLAGGDTRVVPIAGAVQSGFDADHILAMALGNSPRHDVAATALLTQYDRYYLDRRRQRPLPVVLVRMADPHRTRYYIDPRTARLVGAYRAQNWATRWLYHGLHSLDFPWLYNHRPLWDIVVVTWMLGGAALSATSVVLAWNVVVRGLAENFRKSSDSTTPTGA
ncbi:MAG: PepSY domain-containing protein [Acidobacteriota bacterium]